MCTQSVAQPRLDPVTEPPGQTSERPYRVLMLYPFNDTFPSSSRVGQAARQHFLEKRPGRIEIFSHYLDLARFSSVEHKQQTAHALAEKYSTTSPDLIIAIGPASLRFALDYRDLIAPRVPLIFSSIAKLTLASLHPPPDVVGIASEFEAGKTFDLARRLQPQARQLLVIAGASVGDRRWVANARQQLNGRTTGLQTKYSVAAPRADILSEVSRLSSDTIVLLLSVFVDGDGVLFDPGKITEDISNASAAPVYGAVDSFFGRGIVGGYMDSLESMGISAAELGLGILAGEDAHRLASQLSTHHAYRVDARQFERWGLDWSRLPPETLVFYRSATAWEKYRWQILLAAAALLVQSLLIAGLILEHRRRRAAEVEARRRMGELALMNRRAAIGEMSASIAHEIKQPLSAIVTNSDVGLHWLARLTPNKSTDEAAAALKRIAGDVYRANKVVESIRAMFKKDDQSRALLDVNEVVREVLALLHIELEEHGVTVRTAMSDGAPRLPANRIQLQQVILNLARNAIEAMGEVKDRPRVLKLWSGATESGEFIVTIEDTGPGLDPDVLARLFEPFVTTKSTGMGMGLSICRSIIEAHGGRLSVMRARPQGAAFEIVLPLP
jgi:signal transduction histidine kinase